MRRRLAMAIGCALVVAAVSIHGFRQPGNARDWEYGMATLAETSVDDATVHVQHLRDFTWSADGPLSSDYIERSFDVRRLTRVWFVEEPFSIAPVTDFAGVAHTYFVFDFEDQPPVAISVEARRERGETFDAVRGLLNEFELIYVWGTERDLTGSRAVREGNQLFMYPLQLPPTAAQQLFVSLAEETQRLASRPRFYNSLTTNCTNELARVANEVQPGAIPPTIALVFPGFSDEVLYDLGFLPHDQPLADLSQRVAITSVVQQTYQQPDFSTQLRAYLGRA